MEAEVTLVEGVSYSSCLLLVDELRAGRILLGGLQLLGGMHVLLLLLPFIVSLLLGAGYRLIPRLDNR